ncbi:MAG: hypothetical protein WCK89_23290 [bacterium]
MGLNRPMTFLPDDDGDETMRLYRHARSMCIGTGKSADQLFMEMKTERSRAKKAEKDAMSSAQRDADLRAALGPVATKWGIAIDELMRK